MTSPVKNLLIEHQKDTRPLLVRKQRGPRGGKREGAGRPVGKLTLTTRQIADTWLRDGRKAPLDVMLLNMEYYDMSAAQLLARTGVWITPPKDTDEMRQRMLLLRQLATYRDKAQEAARDAAPYMHPKLQNVSLEQKDNKPWRIILANGDEDL